MLPFLEDLSKENYDCISFLPGKDDGELNIETGTYVEKGEEIKGTLGCVYHINIFKQKEDDSIEFDTFEAVLIDPFIYLSHIIPSGWFGFISKKTTDSHEFNQDMVKQMKESFA
jgi:hypothetical protein